MTNQPDKQLRLPDSESNELEVASLSEQREAFVSPTTGGMTLEELVKLLTSLEADLRAFRDFCNPHPLGRKVSECILEDLDPAIDRLYDARQLFGCDPAEPTADIEFYCRDFEFLEGLSERASAIEQDNLAMRNYEIASAVRAIDELRTGFHSAYKYAEEINGY